MAQPERPTGFHATRSVPVPTETLDEFRYHEFGYLSIRYQWN